jgi:hypothetical protein
MVKPGFTSDKQQPFRSAENVAGNVLTTSIGGQSKRHCDYGYMEVTAEKAWL